MKEGHAKLQSSTADKDSQLTSLTSQVASLTAERTQLSGVLETLQAQLADKSADITALFDKNARLVREKADLEARAREAGLGQSRLELETLNLKQQVSSLESQLAAVTRMYEDKAGELLRVQRGTSAASLQLQRDVVELNEQLAIVRRSEERLAARTSELNASLERATGGPWAGGRAADVCQLVTF